MRYMGGWVYCLIAGLFLGCSAADAPPGADAVPERPGVEHVEPVAAQEMEEVDAAIEDVRERIYQLRDTFAGLPAAAQAEYAEQIDSLGYTLREADERFAQLREAGPEAWPDGRRDLQEKLDSLEAAHQQLTAAFADL